MSKTALIFCIVVAISTLVSAFLLWRSLRQNLAPRARGVANGFNLANLSTYFGYLNPWGIAVITLLAMAMLIPGEWKWPVLANWSFWIVTGALVLYSLLGGVLFPTGIDAKLRKQAQSLAKIILILVIAGQIWSAIGKEVPDIDTGKVGKKIEKFFEIPPPPPEVWKGEALIDVGDEWVEFEFPRGINTWRVEPTPDSRAQWEATHPSWRKVFVCPRTAEATTLELPFLPLDRKLKFRSKEPMPITLKMMWR